LSPQSLFRLACFAAKRIEKQFNEKQFNEKQFNEKQFNAKPCARLFRLEMPEIDPALMTWIDSDDSCRVHVSISLKENLAGLQEHAVSARSA
jgi:hypothetical protein